MLKPFSEHPLYRETCDRWELPRDLLIGLSAMRGSVDDAIQDRSKWLPPYPHEDLSTGGSYERRRDRATLFSAFADAVERIASKPFSRGVQVQGLPPEMERLLVDIDGQGTSIDTLGRRHFARKVGFGVGHLLVDWPDTSELRGESGGVPFRIAKRMRPFIVPVSPLHVCNWAWEPSEAGPELAEVHIREDRYEQFGDEMRLVERVRVVTKTEIVVFTKSETGEATPGEPYANTLGVVPLVIDSVGCPDVADVDDPMIAWPPLERIAWLNLAHFQSTSMQRVGLDLMRSITPYERGVPPDELRQTLVLGKAIRRQDMEADLRFVEPAGTGVEHGWRDLQLLEEQMERLGAQPLVRRTGTETATGRLADESKVTSQAESWARGTERALERALGLAWQWMQASPATADPDQGMPDLSVDIVTEFSGLSGGMDAAKLLVDLATAELIPVRVLMEQLVARGLLTDSVDPDEIEDMLAESAAERLRSDAVRVAGSASTAAMPDQDMDTEDDGEPQAQED